ncbi:ABC transporter permease [Bacillus paramobilis]|uniref:ABC transporter permease n=1 Tax=Bacillus paramobilis TaxID=2817477 RepID=UPI000BF689F9|nr:teichoic acid ABC transporter permease [Bacillus cereus]
MKSLKTIVKEQYENLYLIRRLSLYELKQAYAGNLLGLLWVFLNPLSQIGVYWLVFGLGIRGGAPVHGVPYFVWLVCGLVTWFFVGTTITQSANSIYSRLNTVSKMNFPLSIIPTYVVISQLYTHLILIIFALVIVIFNLGFSTINILELLYGLVTSTVFLIALSFLTSTLSTMLRDIQLLIQSVTRMLFFLTPIFWEPKENMSSLLLFIIKINPLYYIVEVYRGALIYNDTSIVLSWYTLYFWGTVTILFLAGSMLHVRFRKQFVDYL